MTMESTKDQSQLIVKQLENNVINQLRLLNWSQEEMDNTDSNST